MTLEVHSSVGLTKCSVLMFSKIHSHIGTHKSLFSSVLFNYRDFIIIPRVIYGTIINNYPLYSLKVGHQHRIELAFLFSN